MSPGSTQNINPAPPSIAEVEAARERIAEFIFETPVVLWRSLEIDRLLGAESEVLLKLELLQRTNSFKVRGALTVALSHSAEQLARGFTAVSSGNHAIAVSQIAHYLGTSAKVVMFASSNPLRRSICQQYGAELLTCETGAQGFEMVDDIVAREGRIHIHSFEGPLISLGNATIALEINQQAPDLDAVVVAIGGGGLCSGLGPAIKQLQPNCRVYAVEPEGAPTMYRSFRSGHTEKEHSINTIADALGAPATEPWSMAMCQQSVDELVLISDQDMRNAMALLFHEMKLVVEPAGAAATAGLLGPLRDRLLGKRVAVMVCGSNIDLDTFSGHLARAARFD